jgi:hypothetical protein
VYYSFFTFCHVVLLVNTVMTKSTAELLQEAERQLQMLAVLDGELWTLPEGRTVYEKRLPGNVLFRVADRQVLNKRIRDERKQAHAKVQELKAKLAGTEALAQAIKEAEEERSGGILGETVVRPMQRKGKQPANTQTGKKTA